MLSSSVIGSAFVAVFKAPCTESRKNLKNSCESCCADPEYMRCLLENAILNSDGFTDRFPGVHNSLINF